MYTCPYCTSENKDSANFCKKCGKRRHVATDFESAQEGICPCCSRRVRHSDRFCMGCGEKLKEKVKLKVKVCLSCKYILPNKATFCVSCGEFVANVSSRKVEINAEIFEEENPELSPKYEA